MSIFSDQYNAMARQMEFSDPRTQELLTLLSKLITGQAYNSLSNDWQTGMNFIGRAIVNSPLGSMAGLSGNNMFGQIHAGVAGAGGIPMMGPGGMYTGHSFGSGANSLALAYGLTGQAATMASDLGLSGNTVAGYIGSAIAQRGFGFGDVKTIAQADTSKQLINTLTENKGSLSEWQQKQIRNQAIALAAFEAYKNDPDNAMPGSMRDHAADIHKQFKLMTPDQRKEYIQKAMGQEYMQAAMQKLELKKEDFPSDLSDAMMASTENFVYTGGNLTTVTSKVTDDLKKGLAANAESIRKLTKVLGTDNFAELEQVARTLHMGSLKNEQDADRIREHMLDAEKTAMATGRTVQEVLGIQGNMVKILASAYGSEEFVNQKALMSSMDRFEVYEKNKRAGYDYRTQQEYIADETAITSNAAKNMQGLHALSYAYDKYSGMFTGESKEEYDRIMKALADPNISSKEVEQLNRDARRLLKSTGMDSEQFYREGMANSTLSDSIYTNSYSRGNVQKYLGRLGDAAFGGAQNKESISAFATTAAYLFGRDTAAFEEVLGAMGQKDDAWNSYLNGLGLSKADADKLNDMRSTWNAKGMNRDAAKFVVHSMQREANLDNSGVVAKAQQDQAFMSSFLAKQKVNLDSNLTGDRSVLLGLFGEGGSVSDEAALVYGMTQLSGEMSNGGLGSFNFDDRGNVVGVDKIWQNNTLKELFGVKDKVDAEKQGLTTQAGFTRKLADLQSKGYVVSQSSNGAIFVGTKEDAQYARTAMNSSMNAIPGMKVVRGMFAGAKVSDFAYADGKYSFKVDGEEKSGASAMEYLHYKMSKDPTLRKELEFKADASNGFDKATVAQAQKTLTAMRALDAAKSFNFTFNKEDSRGVQDWLFKDQRDKDASFNDLVKNYLENPDGKVGDIDKTAAMTKRLDFIDAIRGRSKEELTALGYLDAEGNWTAHAAKASGVKELEGKSTEDDEQLKKLMQAGRTEGPAESILQILSRLVVGDKLKVTND